ncbi:MAG: hypothetical protein HKN13_04670, partial [Rhodothermales bacterium]|nr:hypothetical protein [Rhodothermales bacterium]
IATFSEEVTETTACLVTAYEVVPTVGMPDRVNCSAAAISVVELAFDTPIPGGSYELIVTDIADRSGNILTTASVAFTIEISGDVPLPGDIVVNEIAFDPPEANREYVELLNVSDKTFALADFAFSDNRGVRDPVTNEEALLEPGGYAVLTRDATLFEAAFPSVPFIAPPSWPALNNSGDAVVLHFADLTIDSVAFEPTWGGVNSSLERKDPAGPSNSFANWMTTSDAAGGTPGRQNSVFAPDVEAPVPFFAEQRSETLVRIYFDEPILESTAIPANFEIGSSPALSVSILPGGEIVDLQFPAVSATTIDVSNISDLTGNTLDRISILLARYPDPTEIRISEILYDPRADDSDGVQDQVEFFELYNRGNRTLSLSNMYWTDLPNEDSEADTLRLPVAAASIQPGGYAVVFAQSESTGDLYSESDLVLAFPHDYRSDGVLLIPYSGTSLGLLNSGDLLRLHRSDDAVLDEVQYSPDWHQPTLRDAKGTSLERIDADGPSSIASNWSSSVSESGASPGRTNSINLTFDGDQEGSISVSPSPFSPDGDGVDDFAAIQFNLQAAQSTIRVRIFDSKGRIVRELERGRLATQDGTVVWDGRDDDGNVLGIGIYVAFLEAIDVGGGTVEAHKAALVLARQLD